MLSLRFYFWSFTKSTLVLPDNIMVNEQGIPLSTMLYTQSLPVAQLVEHGASNVKIMGSIPRESKSW